MFPIYLYWCKPVGGNQPTLCVNADPPRNERDRQVLLGYLPQIAERFRQMHLIKEGQTIHWVGRQSTLGTLCRCQESRSLSMLDEYQRLAARLLNVEGFPL